MGDLHYFAYGTNMDRKKMRLTCPTAELVGTARLRDHRLLMNGRGAATIVREPLSVVHGVLWEIDSNDEETLDVDEGLGLNGYNKGIMSVEHREQVYTALVYSSKGVTSIAAPSVSYIRHIMDAAKEHGFPPEYIEELNVWMDFSGSPKAARRVT